jgi:alkyl hydroperoxide reductase subunit AhpC
VLITEGEEGLALRGTFVINPEGKIKTIEVHDNGIGRDVKETLRKLKAAQYVAAHPGEVCPAKWNEGAETSPRRWTWSARSKAPPARQPTARAPGARPGPF